MANSKIKFPATNRQEFAIELRQKVAAYFKDNSLSKYGNWNMVFKSVFMLLLFLTPYFLMLSGIVQSFIGVIICWILIGAGVAGVGMGIMHDANHGTLSGNRGVNKLLGMTMYLLGGFPPNWIYQHNTMHHGFTNIEGFDEDISPGAYLRISPHKPMLKIHRYQHIYAWFLYGLMTLSWVLTKDFEQLNDYKKQGIKLNGGKSYYRLFIILAVSKLIYYSVFLLIPMLVLPFNWYWVILFFLIMHFISGLILTTIFQTAHVVPSSLFPLPDDTGSMENSWVIHQLLTTSDFSPDSRILSWFIGGLNYQVEHHLFPNISHVHYPRISGIVRAMADKYGLPYHVQHGFFKAVREHGRMLKLLGRN